MDIVVALVLVALSYWLGGCHGRRMTDGEREVIVQTVVGSPPDMDVLNIEWQFHARVVDFGKMTVREFDANAVPELAPIVYRYQWRAILGIVTDEDVPPNLRAFIERPTRQGAPDASP